MGAIVIGSLTSVNDVSTSDAVVLKQPKTSSGITIGAAATSDRGVSIGYGASGKLNDVIIGRSAENVVGNRFSNGVAVGYAAKITGRSTAIGSNAMACNESTPNNQCLAIGSYADTSDAITSCAIGDYSKIGSSTNTSDGQSITNAVQLGKGTNSKSNSIQFLDTTLFENGKLNLDTIVLNDSVANADGTVNKYKLKVTNGVLGVELITEEVTA